MLRTSALVASVAQRRTEDAVNALERRGQPRAMYATVDFGTTPTTSASAPLDGLSWLTRDMVAVCTPTTAAQVTAGLVAFAVDLVPARGFTLVLRSTSNLTGPQRVGVLVS